MKKYESLIFLVVLIALSAKLSCYFFTDYQYVLIFLAQIFFSIGFILNGNSFWINIIAWVYLSTVFNTFITSLFGIGITESEHLIIAFVSLLFSSVGITYNISKWRHTSQSVKCKKDAIQKYKTIVNKFDLMDGRFNSLNEKIDDTESRLDNIFKNIKEK